MTQPPRNTKALTVAEIATLTGAQPAAGAPLDRIINHIAPLDAAGPGDLAFFENFKYLDDLAVTHAGACLLAPRYVGKAGPIEGLQQLWATYGSR
jgi:UDP-3-O-[3-hydroxymyristoyl] glucosamine N-acyltransferase